MRLHLAKLQYTMCPLPDTWLKFDMKTCTFKSTGLINKLVSTSKIVLPNNCTKPFTTYNAVHYNVNNPNIPFVTSKAHTKLDYHKLLVASGKLAANAKLTNFY